MYKCKKCNAEKELQFFVKDKKTKLGIRNICLSCQSLYQKQRKDKDERKIREELNSTMRRFRSTWKGATLTSLAASRIRAKKAGIPHTVSLDFLRQLLDKQEYQCALTGVQLEPNSGWNSPSLDKIDPARGYVEGNVQWLSQRCNLMKSNLTQDEFVTLCKRIYEKGSETIREEYASSEAEAPETENQS